MKIRNREDEMKTRNLILLFTALCLLVSSCIGNSMITTKSVISTNTEQKEVISPTTNAPTNTNTPTLTQTPVPTITRTPLPTVNKHPSTPTVERPVEWDLNPFYEKKIDTEWEGVKIKASILIDGSLKDRIKSIDMMDSLLAEIVARTIFYVWYSRNHPDVPWNSYVRSCLRLYNYPEPTLDEEAIYPYMKLWAKAQETGNYSDWEKVQLQNVWANDLSDGNGYIQKPYTIWPMYEGNVPENIIAVKNLTFVFVDTNLVHNRIKREDCDDIYMIRFNKSWGTNLDLENNSLLVYIGYSFGHDVYLGSSSREESFERATRILFSEIGGWLSLNYSNPTIFGFSIPGDPNIENCIERWGIDIDLTEE